MEYGYQTLPIEDNSVRIDVVWHLANESGIKRKFVDFRAKFKLTSFNVYVRLTSVVRPKRGTLAWVISISKVKYSRNVLRGSSLTFYPTFWGIRNFPRSLFGYVRAVNGTHTRTQNFSTLDLPLRQRHPHQGRAHDSVLSARLLMFFVEKEI